MFIASKVASVRKGKVQNESNGDAIANKCCGTSVEMEKSNEILRELKTHFNVMLSLLRLQRQKRIRQTATSSLVLTTTESQAPSSTFRTIQYH